MKEPLTRAALSAREGGAPATAPVRIIHLGIGRFFRAHQAWYTGRAGDASEWGIAAFTGRSDAVANALTSQDGLFCLIERSAGGDDVQVVTSVSEAHPGADVARFVELVARPEVALITLTVTESGYLLRPDGSPDLAQGQLAQDITALRSGRSDDTRTVLGRLVAGLAARRSSNGASIALVPCDNIPRNGAFLARGVVGVAEAVSSELAVWISENVSFVSTSVDRITPHTDGAGTVLEHTGWVDRAAVVTEPFSDWVLSGEFPAGRPLWESAGARFVDDIEPWENRKLWLLNGAHSILTFAGQLRGHDTVAEAIADAECRDLVERFWDEAVGCLPERTEHVVYREQLVTRFANSRIVHPLAQIATEATTKVRYRIAAVAERTLAEGRMPTGTVTAFALWLEWARTFPGGNGDADAIDIALTSHDPVEAMIALVSETLRRSPQFVAAVRAAAADRTATEQGAISKT